MAFKMKNSSMAKLAKEAGNNRVSPVKAKRKFTEDTRSKEYIGDYSDIRKRTAVPESKTERDMSIEAQQENVQKMGVDPKMKVTDVESQAEANVKKRKSDDNLTSDASGNLRLRDTKVRVKVKGKKAKGVVSDPSTPASNIKDVKKVKMSAGRGKSKKTVKVKYDKQGNVKKETTRYGRLGLSKKKRASGSVAVGTKEGKDLKGAAAAEAIVKRQGTNIRGRKRKGGETKDKSA